MSPLVRVSRTARFRKNFGKTISSPRFLIAAMVVVTAVIALYVPVGSKEAPPALPVIQEQRPGVQTPRPLKVNYSNNALTVQGTRARALATADFNMDGAPDLITGFGTGSSGMVSLQLGNLDAYAPSSPEVYRAIHQGRMPDAFKPSAETISVPQAADFLIAGDFNHDGFHDALIGTRGLGLYLLAGDGTGKFAEPREIFVAGVVTALASGKFNRGGSISDVAVAVNDGSGAKVLVFDDQEGGILGTPLSYPLSGDATSLVLDSLDGDHNYDVAAVTGSQIEIVHGSGEGSGSSVASAARVERIPLGFQARAIVAEEFIWDRANRNELAVLAADGAVHMLSRPGLDTRPFTDAEKAQLAWDRENVQLTDVELERRAASVPVWQASRSENWDNAGQIAGVKAAEGSFGMVAGHTGRRLGADLIVMNDSNHQLNLLRDPAQRLITGKPTEDSLVSATASDVVDLQVESAPVAVLQMPRKVNGSRDIVVLKEDSPDAIIVPMNAAFNIVVDTLADNPALSACTGSPGPIDCSLRGAITFANANPDTQITVPAGTYNLTNAAGEMNPDASPLSIVGAGAATTIIDQNLVGERIFLVDNTAPFANFNFSLSGLTLRDGNRLSGSGGAILGGGLASQTVLTNCIFDNNSAIVGPSGLFGRGGAIILLGGGASPDPIYDAGDLDITGCTFSNNTARNTGGGVCFFGGAVGTPTVDVVSSTFTNNESEINDGGALDLTSGGGLGAYTVTKSTFTNNRALATLPADQPDHDGGAINKGEGSLNVSFSRFFQNSPNSGGQGDSALRASGAGTVIIENNWWGCNGDPTTPAAGCDKVENGTPVGTTFDYQPRLQLTHTANPLAVVLGASTTLTASFLKDSANNNVSAANLDVLLNLPIVFNNAVKGTLSGADTIISDGSPGTAGTAVATFTAGITTNDCGNGGADAKVDNQTTTAPVTVLCPDLTIAKANNVSNIAVVGQTWTWTLTVTNGGNTGAIFANGSTILTDNLPNHANITYNVTTPIVLSAPNSGTVNCSINGTKDLTCTANGQVIVANGVGGSFNVLVTAVSSTAIGLQTNPRSAGILRVDPGNAVVESNEANNDGVANSVTVNQAATTTTITNTASPGLGDATVVGQPYTVQWNVAVNAPGNGPPAGAALTGNVTVSDGAQTCLAAVSVGQCSLTSFTAGAKTITATYAGDANYIGDASPGDPHTVNKADTSTTITNAASLLATPTVVGELYAVNWNVTVDAPGSLGAALTGNVTVSDGSQTCVAAVSAGTCNLTSTTAGVKNLVATYAGDINYITSASAGDSHTVNKADTSTTITNAASLLATPTVVGEAYAVNWNVTVDAPGSLGAALTGNVTVSDGSQTCFAAVSVGTCNLTSTTAGVKNLVATYDGDINYNGSASAGDVHTVNPAATTTTITNAASLLATPTVVGEAYIVQWSVVVNPPGALGPALTGNVTVSDGLDTCVADVNVGQCSLTSTTVGAPKTLIATYAGDSNYAGDASPGDPHTVNAAATTTNITLDSPDPSTAGQGVTVNFSVTANPPGGGTPTGTVTITVNDLSGDTCNGTLAGGVGTCNLVLTTDGIKTLTATYATDGNYTGSVDNDEQHTVISCEPPPQPANMKAWFTGDGTPRDVAGGHDGTLQGDAAYAAGKVLQAFTLDGAGDFVSALDSPAWDFGAGDFTIDLWANFDTVNTTNALVAHDDGAGSANKWIFWVNNGNLEFHTNDTVGNAVTVGVPFAPTPATWYHLGVKRSGTSYTFYINGVPSSPIVEATAVPDASAVLTIGSAEGGFFVDGLIDEVEIFDVALTDAEVLLIFSTPAGKCKPSDLKITKSHTDPFIQGSTGNTYTITVSNDGPTATDGMVTVTDTLPTGLTPTAPIGAHNGWNCAIVAQTLTCDRSDVLASGASYPAITLEVTAGVDIASVTNTVAVSGGGQMDTSDSTASDPTNLTPSADLSVSKSDSPDPVIAGANITYTMSISNSGPSTAQTVELKDTVPANTTFVSIVQNTGALFVCSDPGVGNTGDVTCTVATLASGDSASFTLIVKVNAATPEGTTITNDAVGSSATGDPNSLNNTGTATTAVNQSDIEITSKTDTPDPVSAGNNITYTVNFKNNSAVTPANDVTVTDAVPANTTLVSATTASPGWARTDALNAGDTGNIVFSKTPVAGGETAVFTIVVKVNANTPSGSTITNTATAATTSLDNVSANNSVSTTTTTDTSADLQVTSKTDAPDPVLASQNITYTINFVNNGPSDAQTVTVTDAVPTGTTFVSSSITLGTGWTMPSPPPVGGTGNVVFSKGTVAAAETATFSIVVKVNANAVEGSTITNNALADSATTDPTPGNDTGTATTTVNQSDIEVTSKTDTPDPVTAGENITYTINFKNNSAVNSAADVSVTDTIPVGTTFVSVVTAAGWTPVTPAVGGTGNVVFSKALVAAGETATFTVGVKVDANVLTGTTITNTATAATTSVDTNTPNNSATATTAVQARADLQVSKTDSPDPVIAGSNLTYTINFVNNGPSDSQTVTVTDAVPANTTYVSSGITTGTGWTIPSPPAVGGTGNVVFSKATVAAGETATFTMVVKVNSNTPPATVISNDATAAGTTIDPTPGNNTGNATTTVVTSADLLVVKIDSPDPVPVGQNLTYTITVTNGGNSDAQSVSLSDPIPGNTTLVSFTVPLGWTRTDVILAGGTGTVTATTPTLVSGASAIFTLVVNVNPGTPHNTILTNTATASTTTTDPDLANNVSTTQTTVVADPDMTVTKTHAGNFAQGQVGATYTITVNNAGSGPTNGSTVTVTDNVPVGLTPTAPVGAHNGWTCSIVSQTLTCTRSDVLAGFTSYPAITLTVNVANPAPLTVTNTVTVSGGGEVNTSNNSASDVTLIDCTNDASLNNANPLVISRFRENGPGGVTDEFVEIFNPSNSPHTVASGTCTGGYGVFASAGNGTTANDVSMVCQIPNGTVIPARGYYLCTGTGYTLGNLGRNGGSTTAEGDAPIGCGGTCTADIPNDAGLALINVGANIVVNTLGGFVAASIDGSALIVYDKVGFSAYGAGAPASSRPSLAGNFCEGTCLQPVGDASTLPGCTNPTGLFPVVSTPPACYGQSGQYEVLRRQIVFNASTGTLHQDTNINTGDWLMVSPNPGNNVGLNLSGVAGLKPVLGAAAPHDSTAPADFPTTILSRTPFDVGSQTGPRNAERIYSLDPTVADTANNPLGTYALRFKYTNNSATPITALRFSIDDLSTLCGPQSALETGTGDARNLSSTPNCQNGNTFSAILKVLNSSSEIIVDSTSTAQSVKGLVMEDLTVTGALIPAPGPLSPQGGGIDNSLVVNPSTSSGSLGDGVNGGTGQFATVIGTTEPTKHLRVKVKFGVARTGRFIVLVVPMGKNTP